MSSAPVRVQSVIDESPMNLRRWSVVLVCFAIALLDGFDTQSIAFIGSSIAEEFSMSTAGMTWVITASTVGMALGAITLGSVGDRIGRKRAIIIALAVFGIFSMLGAFAQDPWQIVALRFLIGLGMGGATPSLLALAAEYSPSSKRGLSMTLVLLGLPGGAMLGGIVAAAWLPVLGWRGIFFLGGVLPIVMLLVVMALPESPSYLASRTDEKSHRQARTLLQRMTGITIADDAPLVTEGRETSAGSIRSLFAPEYRSSTIAICAVYLANWIAWFLLLQWMPTALHEAGLSKEAAATGTVLVNGGFIVFSFLVTALLTRVAIRSLLLSMFGLGILVALGLGLAVGGANWTLAFTLITLAGLGIGGQQLVLNYLIAERYPTRLRGTATGFSIGVGRTGSIIGSALGGWLLATAGVGGYFAAIAVPLAVAAVATLLLQTRPKAGEPVEVVPDVVLVADRD